VWCLFLNRIPTKDSWVRRGVLSNNNEICIDGCDMNEDMNQLFFRCNFYGSIWSLVSDWLQFVTITQDNMLNHLEHFGGLGGSSKHVHLALKL